MPANCAKSASLVLETLMKPGAVICRRARSRCRVAGGGDILLDDRPVETLWLEQVSALIGT